MLRGVECETYTLRSPSYNETTGFNGNYTLYGTRFHVLLTPSKSSYKCRSVSKDSGIPLRFHFTGFNVILGSHYDEYIFDYLEVVPNLEGLAPACFAPPAKMTCSELQNDDGDDGGGPTNPFPGVSRRPKVSRAAQRCCIVPASPGPARRLNRRIRGSLLRSWWACSRGGAGGERLASRPGPAATAKPTRPTLRDSTGLPSITVPLALPRSTHRVAVRR